MSVKAFGRELRKKSAGERGPPGVGYKLTSDGYYYCRKLCNIEDPSEYEDAVNLKFSRIKNLRNHNRYESIERKYH